MTTRKHKKPKHNKSSNRFRRTRSKKHIGGGNNKPLRVAIDAGDIEKVRLLLDKGTDVNERDDYQYMPLHRALEKGRGDIAKMLLDKGADIEAKSESGGTALKTAIWYAGWNDYKDIVEMLLKKGADVNAKDYEGNSPLMTAISTGRNNNEMVEMLLKNGADVNAKDNEGDTALSYASLKGNIEIVRLLLENGADVKSTNNAGRTALYLAKWRERAKVVILLRQAELGLDTQIIPRHLERQQDKKNLDMVMSAKDVGNRGDKKMPVELADKIGEYLGGRKSMKNKKSKRKTRRTKKH